MTIDVATNDSDPDDNLDPTTTNTLCPSRTQPGNGSLLNNGNGTFDYTHIPNFNGPDNFLG